MLKIAKKLRKSRFYLQGWQWQPPALILITAIIIVVGIIYIFNKPEPVEAGWYNDSWAYRQILSISNSGSAQTNAQVKILNAVDLSSLVTAGKLQSDLDDLRFTDTNGNILKYWIEDAISSSVDVWAFIDYVPDDGAYIFMYYGNPLAGIGETVFGSGDYPGISCKSILLSGATSDGVYYIDPTAQETDDKIEVYCDMTTDGGGWTLIMQTSTSSAYTYADTVWTNTSGGSTTAGDPNVNQDYVSSSFYLLLGTESKLALGNQSYWNSWTHASDTARNLSNQTRMTGAQGSYGNCASRTNCGTEPINLKPQGIERGTSGTSSGAWHRFGYVNDANAWGQDVRVGFSGDNDSSDSTDTVMGLGLRCEGNCVATSTTDGAHNTGSGYYFYTSWGGTPLDDAKQGWLWLRGIDISSSNLSSGAPSTEEKGLGPSAYWKFDEGFGTTAHDNATANNYIRSATGGTITEVGGYRIHTFTSSGTFTPITGGVVEVLVVAAGGGGGSSQTSLGGGGGGGAGGLLYESKKTISGTSYSVVIGSGGSPGATGSSQQGSDGGNSSFADMIAIGGGGGDKGSAGTGGRDGGSGGGGGYNSYTTPRIGGEGTTGQGNAGGDTSWLAWAGGAGGGGGGGVGGDNKSGHVGGDPGPGLTYLISGSSVTYAEGGAGGSNSPGASAANTGNGGDAAYAAGTAYAGADGIVIIRYPINNDGTITGAEWKPEDNCVSGKCLEFDGVDDYVEVEHSTALNTSLQSGLTMSAWIKPKSAGELNYGRIFSKAADANGTAGFYLRLDSASQRLAARVNAGSTIYSATNSIVYANGSWYYVTATINSSGLVTFYVNGVQSGTPASTSALSGVTTTSDLRIGNASSGTTNTFDGFIDEPKIYNYIRTAAQIKADYLAGQSGSPSGVGASFGGGQQQSQSEGLVGYWKMDESSWTNNCSTDTVLDSSGNSNDGDACPVTTGPTGSAIGKYGNAGSFDGTDDYVDVLGMTSFDLYNISFWMNAPDGILRTYAGYYPTLFAFNNMSPSMHISGSSWTSGATDETLHIWNYQSGSGMRYIKDEFAANTWYFVSINWNGSYYDFYVNGDLKTSYQWSNDEASLITGITTMRIADNYDTYEYKGKLDNVKVYNVARTADQIMKDYKTGPGPVTYYNFEEGSGTNLYDKSGNNFNSSSFNGSPTWSLGKQGGALYFDGISDYIDLPTSMIPLNNKITICTWAKGEDEPRANSIFMATDQVINSHINYSNGLTYWDFGDSPYDRISKANNSAFFNTWNHWCYISDDEENVMSIYVNGNVWLTAAHAKALTVTPAAFTLGAGVGGTLPYKGWIDEFKIYNYARTPEQILWDMYGDESPHPALHFSLNEGYGTVVQDQGYLNDDGALRDSPTWTTNGKFGSGLQLDGLNDRITEFNAANTKYVGEDMSLSIWIKPDTDPDGGKIFSKPWNGSGQYNYHLSLNTSRTLTLYLFGESGSSLSTTDTLSNDTWHHVVATVHGSSKLMSIYIDGKLSVSQTHTITSWVPSLGDAGTTMQIGSLYPYADGWGGTTSYSIKATIDEPKFYKITLSAEQIRQEYTRGAQVSLGQQKSSSETWDAGGFGGIAPIAYWNFEEGSGTAAQDISNGNYTGTIVNAIYTLGKPGWALNFDGTGDYISMTRFTIPSSNITLEAWVKTTSTDSGKNYSGNAAQTVIGDHTNGVGLGFGLTGGKVQYNYYTSGWYAVTGNVPVNDDNWHHIVATHASGGVVNLYVDGKLDNSGSITVSGNRGVDRLGGGYLDQTGTGDTFNGIIDGVRIFTEVRTQAQIAYDYNGGKPVGWWPLDDKEGVTAIDISGNNHHGTLYGLTGDDWVDGIREYGVNFDGTGEAGSADNIDVIKVSDSDDLDVHIGNAYSITFWVNNDSYVCTAHTKKAGQWEIYRCDGTSDSVVTTRISTPSDSNHSGSTPINNGQWYHIATTYDSATSELHLYVDGKEESGFPKTVSGTVSATTNDLGIGAYNTGAFSTNGTIDDYRIYNYALTVDQVKEVMNYGSVYIK